MTTTARRRLAGFGLLLLILAVAALLVVPIAILRPFSPQTPRGVQVAFWLRHFAPWATIVAAVAGLALVARLWRGARWWTRVIMPVAVLLLAAGAWAAQQNVFERMFSPLPDVRFAPAAQADWVAADEPVIAVALGGEARAYPVRQLAYHHVANDVVGGVPIVATY